MKNYYELSYIDDFGNGEFKYFYCTEQDIKNKAKELFETEKKLAVDQVDSYEHEKPYYFDEKLCNGFVVKKVGFVLAHFIEWRQIFSNVKNTKLKNAYSVIYVGHYMCNSYIGTYASLKKAKEIVIGNNIRPNEIEIYGYDEEKLPNGKFIKSKNGYTHSYFYYQKVSYEYDECDLTSNTYSIDIYEIERL